MFERYTEKARRVIFYARYEASEFGASAIETEHLLLGVVREDKALLNLVLPALDSAEAVRAEVEAHTAKLEKAPAQLEMPLSNACKRVLAYAAEEAERLGHKHIGTEHLFLGLLREEGCFAAELLQSRGANLKQARQVVAAAPVRKPSMEDEQAAKAAFGRILERHESGQADGPLKAKKIGFEMYSEGARRAIFFARREAVAFGSPAIESEHLLLAVLAADESLSRRFLTVETAPMSLHEEIARNSSYPESGKTDSNMPFSNECKRVLAYAAEEADRLGQTRVGAEHLLLGLLREVGCFGAQLLVERGADIEAIRAALRDAPGA